MSVSDFTPIERLALEIAIVTKVKRSKYANHAIVPWRLIEELRTAIGAAGVDWLELHKRARQILVQRREAKS